MTSPPTPTPSNTLGSTTVVDASVVEDTEAVVDVVDESTEGLHADNVNMQTSNVTNIDCFKSIPSDRSRGVFLQAQATVLSTRILPRTRVSTAVLVIGFAALTAVAAQIRIPLGFTPVPLTGQTFAVLLSGAALGLRAGAAAQALYVAIGLAGFPVFQGGEGGWSYATGATAGYLVGFIVAAAVAGYLAEQRQDRRIVTAIPAMLAGNTIIYLIGVPWLMHVLGVDLAAGLTAGFAPFVVGDLLKIAAVGLLLPAVWKMVGEQR